MPLACVVTVQPDLTLSWTVGVSANRRCSPPEEIHFVMNPFGVSRDDGEGGYQCRKGPESKCT